MKTKQKKLFPKIKDAAETKSASFKRRLKSICKTVRAHALKELTTTRTFREYMGDNQDQDAIAAWHAEGSRHANVKHTRAARLHLRFEAAHRAEKCQNIEELRKLLVALENEDFLGTHRCISWMWLLMTVAEIYRCLKGKGWYTPPCVSEQSQNNAINGMAPIRLENILDRQTKEDTGNQWLDM